MHTGAIFIYLIASALAAPAPVQAISAIQRSARDNIDWDSIIVGVDAPPLNPKTRLNRRQGQCNVEYCQQRFNACVKTCSSLVNGDWYVQAPRP